MRLSYRDQLLGIKESPKNDGVSYRNFACTSESLKRTIQAMNSPSPEKWFVSSEYKNSGFREDSQGVAHDGTHWYFTANGNKGRQGVFKYSTSMNLISELKLSYNRDLMTVRNIPTTVAPEILDGLEYPIFGHVGDPECYNDKIYLPMQGPHGFLTMNTNFDVSSIKWYPTPEIGDSHPWCAINPLNRKLYTSSFVNEDLEKSEYKLTLYAYDSHTLKREAVHDIRLKTATVRVQGGCFSPNGMLFLTSDAKHMLNYINMLDYFTDYSNPGLQDEYSKNIQSVIASGVSLRPCITIYSPVNGHYFGSVPIMRESGIGYFQEVEGVTYWERSEKGKKTRLHVVLLQNELGTDEVFFKHYSDIS